MILNDYVSMKNKIGKYYKSAFSQKHLFVEINVLLTFNLTSTEQRFQSISFLPSFLKVATLDTQITENVYKNSIVSEHVRSSLIIVYLTNLIFTKTVEWYKT